MRVLIIIIIAFSFHLCEKNERRTDYEKVSIKISEMQKDGSSLGFHPSTPGIMYFNLNLQNNLNEKIKINISEKDIRIYHPIGVDYHYYNTIRKKYSSNRGRGDFFDLKEISIEPHQNINFASVAVLPENVDSFTLYYNYINLNDKECMISLKYNVGVGYVINLVDEQLTCDDDQ